jgi:hypothetical protein
MPTFRVGLPSHVADEFDTQLSEAGWTVAAVTGTGGTPDRVLIEGDAEDSDAAREAVAEITGISAYNLPVFPVD